MAKRLRTRLPTAKRRHETLVDLEQSFSRIRQLIEGAPWLYGSLVGHETRQLFQSNEVIRLMALRGQPEHEHCDLCHLRAISFVEGDLDAIDRLQESIIQLRDDPAGQVVSEMRSARDNASQPQLRYLDEAIYALWVGRLGLEPDVRAGSLYVAFGSCLFDLVGHSNRTEDQLMRRMRSTLRAVDSESREK